MLLRRLSLKEYNEKKEHTARLKISFTEVEMP
jgi:hypothetical protein